MTLSSRQATRRSWATGHATSRRPSMSSAHARAARLQARGWRLAAPPAPHAAQLIERLTGALRSDASVLYLAGRDRKDAIEAALSGTFALEVVESLCGRGALKLAYAGGAGSRVLRRGAALLAPIGRARGRTRQGFWRGGAVSRASPLLPLGRCGRAAQGARRGPHRGRRNARRGGAFSPVIPRPPRVSFPWGLPYIRPRKIEDASRWSTRKPRTLRPDAAGAPVNRDARPDPGVIEGEIAARGAHEDGPSPGAAEAASEAASSNSRVRARRRQAGPNWRSCFRGRRARGPDRLRARRRRRRLFLGLEGRSRGGARTGWLDSRRRLQRENAALDAEAKRESGAVASLDKRVSALEASASASGAAELDKRVSALEAANAEDAPGIAAATETAQRLAKQVADTRADVDAARAEIPSLSARVAKLETGRQDERRRPRSFRSRRPRRQDRGGARRAQERNARRSRAARACRQRRRDRHHRRGMRKIGSPRARRLDPSSQPPAPRRRSGGTGAAASGGQWARRPAARWPHRSTRLRRKCWPRRLRRRTGGVTRSLSRPYAQSRAGARSERDRRRRSAGDSLSDRGRMPARRHRAARSPRSTSFPKPRVRRRAIGRLRPARGRRRTRRCSRSARRRSGDSRAAQAHEIAAAGRPRRLRRAPAF